MFMSFININYYFQRRLGDHKNIVRYYESRIDALPVGGFEALILMEYCPGKSNEYLLVYIQVQTNIYF